MWICDKSTKSGSPNQWKSNKTDLYKKFGKYLKSA
jgi:hypothetical protein